VVIGIRRATDPKLCVIRALEASLGARGNEPGALFTRITKNGRVTLDRLSDKAVVRTVKACLEPIGLDPKKYAGHGLRAGLATTADVRRAALQDIQRNRAIAASTASCPTSATMRAGAIT
jgi:hypothetical protein